MPRKPIVTFTIDYLQIMDEKGTIDKELLPDISRNILITMYKKMVLSRKFDAKVFSLQRQGRVSTYAQVKGQEACQIGAMACLEKDDWMIPSFRESAAFIYRGAQLKDILLYAGGDERGSVVEGEQHDLPVSIPVASQTIHASGIAWGMKLKKEKNVVVCFLGDGATSEGEFHEALNFAGVFKLPVIFICQNNQFALSTRNKDQTASETFAQKAIAYGIEGIKVDGNDIFAVYVAVHEATERAREGKGASLIECFTYRLGDHTTSDDAKKYRDEKEVRDWEKKDPISRFKNYLIKEKLWSEKEEKNLLKEVEKEIKKGVKEYESTPVPDPEDMFKFMYADMIPELEEQLRYLKQFKRKYYG